MASKKSKQSPGCKKKVESALAKLINERLDVLGWNQADLAAAANMPESRLSRIMNGTRRKGNTAAVNEHDINQIALALKMGRTGRDKLRYAAWPELVYIDEALGSGEGVISLNSRLSDLGLPMLGTPNPKE